MAMNVLPKMVGIGMVQMGVLMGMVWLWPNQVGQASTAGFAKAQPAQALLTPTEAPSVQPNKTVVSAETVTTKAPNSVPPQSSVTSIPAPTEAPQDIAPTPDSRCLIRVDGGVYDVTAFKAIHSGGDIFQCGTDMSVIFNGQHPADYLQRMQQYRIQ